MQGATHITPPIPVDAGISDREPPAGDAADRGECSSPSPVTRCRHPPNIDPPSAILPFEKVHVSFVRLSRAKSKKLIDLLETSAPQSHWGAL